MCLHSILQNALHKVKSILSRSHSALRKLPRKEHTMPHEEMIPLSVYYEHVLRANRASNRFSFRRDYVQLMSTLTAVFLQDVIDRASLDGTKKITLEIDGKQRICAMMTVKYLSSKGSLRWTLREQKYHFKNLKAKAYTGTKRIGTKGVRYVWIDLKKIEDDLTILMGQNFPYSDISDGTKLSLEDVSDGTKLSPKGVKTKKRREGVKTNCRPKADRESSEDSNGRKDSKASSSDTSRRLATRLYQILRKHQHIGSSISVKGWAAHFSSALKDHSEKEVDTVLDWYDLHIEETFTPQFYCARTFCGEIGRVIRAKRVQEDKTSSSKNGHFNNRLREDQIA